MLKAKIILVSCFCLENANPVIILKTLDCIQETCDQCRIFDMWHEGFGAA